MTTDDSPTLYIPGATRFTCAMWADLLTDVVNAWEENILKGCVLPTGFTITTADDVRAYAAWLRTGAILSSVAEPRRHATTSREGRAVPLPNEGPDDSAETRVRWWRDGESWRVIWPLYYDGDSIRADVRSVLGALEDRVRQLERRNTQLREYVALLERGMSSHEARATIWPAEATTPHTEDPTNG